MKKLIPVYPWPLHPKVAEVLPDGYQYEEALPGSPGPILAIRTAPPWVCDAIVVLEPHRAAQAVDIIASDGIKLVTVRDMLSEIFGAPLVETSGPYQTPAQKAVKFL